jgi:hypothetical protein
MTVDVPLSQLCHNFITISVIFMCHTADRSTGLQIALERLDGWML